MQFSLPLWTASARLSAGANRLPAAEDAAERQDLPTKPETAGASSPLSGQHALVELKQVTKRFSSGGGAFAALENVDLAIGKYEFVALIGPSGCGKSTILRLIAGLETPTEGKLLIDGAEGPGDFINNNRLGVAFQDHALLPWLSAWDNVALPYKITGRKVNEQRIAWLLNLMGLNGFEKSRPRQLSGGMRQRVAIARSLVLRPELLLLDEPFGALDAVTRRRLNIELQALWSADRLTTLLVTHSVEEAIFLADRVIVMSPRPGRVRMEKTIPFQRPRQPDIMRSPQFHALSDELTEALDELEAPGPDGRTS